MYIRLNWADHQNKKHPEIWEALCTYNLYKYIFSTFPHFFYSIFLKYHWVNYCYVKISVINLKNDKEKMLYSPTNKKERNRLNMYICWLSLWGAVCTECTCGWGLEASCEDDQFRFFSLKSSYFSCSYASIFHFALFPSKELWLG